jgi:hypothetical protein
MELTIRIIHSGRQFVLGLASGVSIAFISQVIFQPFC